jgi:hypothetical protein
VADNSWSLRQPVAASRWPPGAKAAGGDPAPPCRARAALRVDHGFQRTAPCAGGHRALAAVTFDNSFRLLANKLLQLTAASFPLLSTPPLARGDYHGLGLLDRYPHGLLMRLQLNSGTLDRAGRQR